VSNINWVGKSGSQGRVGRGGSMIDMSETRWIVPIRPYQAPKDSIEKAENAILMGAGVAAIIFGFTLMILSAMA
jgi:hypothetical protein